MWNIGRAMLETSARLLGLLSVLQSRRFWSGSDLAERLEVNARTLRRDVDRLRALGYTVESTSGPGGGYQLGRGSEMPPLLLTDKEAVAVAVALRVATQSFIGFGEAAVEVLVKMEQLLPKRLRRRLGALEAVTVSLTSSSAGLDAEVLTTLASACREHQRLILSYKDRKGLCTKRRLEPHQLAHTPGQRWYLVAWDLDREDWRTFRLDRMEGSPQLGEFFAPRELPGGVEAYFASAFIEAPYEQSARLRLLGSFRELSEQVPAWCGVLEADGDTHCILSTGASSVEGLVCRMILTGTEFELLEPNHLLEAVREVSERLQRGIASGNT